MTERLLTTTETCEKLGVSRWTLLKWEESEELIPVKTKGGHRRFRESDVLRIMGVATNTTTNLEVVAVYTRRKKSHLSVVGGDDRCN